jgi:hypothetical protein
MQVIGPHLSEDVLASAAQPFQCIIGARQKRQSELLGSDHGCF